MATVSFPYATLCVQGIKDGVTSEALEAQFEHYGRVRNVNLAQNKNMKGVPDTRIALVEFARRDDARRAMQELNGRNVQGKCVMIRFARSSPGMRSAAPAVRRGVPELIPQTASHERLLAAKRGPQSHQMLVGAGYPCA
ncbi:Syncrip [Symbiodinium microadriaticum]|nr:Syncrip [Symbiodinium microadriaticum]